MDQLDLYPVWVFCCSPKLGFHQGECVCFVFEAFQYLTSVIAFHHQLLIAKGELAVGANVFGFY